MRKVALGIRMVAVSVVAALCVSAWAAGEFTAGGRVVNESGEAIAGARACAIELGYPWGTGYKETQIVAESETDESGRFTIILKKMPTPQEQYIFAARHPDYGIAWIMSWSFQYGGENIADFTLTMPKRGAIRGTVSDLQGNPVAGARVTPSITSHATGPLSIPLFFPSCDQLLSVVTAADGSFVLDGLPEKAFVTLKVSHPDFAVSLHGAGSFGMTGMPAGTVRVGETNIRVELEPGATIEGKVTFVSTDEAAQGALVDAVLAAMRERDPSTQARAMMHGPVKAETGDDGRYTLRGFAEGTYGLQVDYPDWAAEAKQSVKVDKAERVTGQDFVLGKGVLVSGKFIHADTGEPVPDGYVGIQAGPGFMQSPALKMRADADSTGTFQFRQPPGQVTLYARAESSGFIPSEQSRREITLASGQDQTDLTFEVKPWIRLRGRVLGPKSRALADALVHSRDRADLSAKTDDTGAFELPLVGLQPGEDRFIRLEARHPDLPGYRGALVKRFESEEDAQGEIQMKRMGSAKGRVVNVRGEPFKSAKVTVDQDVPFDRTNAHYSSHSTMTDEYGRYRFKDLVSAYRCSVRATADGYGQGRAEAFSVSEGQVYEVPDLVLHVADKSIEGMVTDVDGEPIAGAHITGNGPSTGGRMTITDEKGRYRLEQLVDEEIQLQAYSQEPGGTLYGRSTAKPGDERADIILVQQQQPMRPRQREAQLFVNKRAAELDVADWINGEPTTLASLRGKTVVLAFWDSADQKCADIVPVLNRVATTSYTPDVEVVSIHSSDAQADKLKQYTADKSITFRVALDKPADRYRGATFERYQVRRLPAIYVIDVAGIVRYQDIPVAAVEEAVKNVPTDVEAQAEPAPETPEPLPPAGDRARRACANNLKQLGLVCKMYANEWRGKFPPIDDRRGNLAMEGKAIFPEYLSDLNVLICPGNAEHEPIPRRGTADDVTDQSYFYLGWAVMTEEEGLALLDAYESLDLAQRDTDIQVGEGKGNGGGNRIYRLREGIERFFITDINNPAASAVAQSELPVMWDRPTNHQDPPGGTVLYMDGHVEFVRYPGKFPMTPAFIKRCEEISAKKKRQ